MHMLMIEGCPVTAPRISDPSRMRSLVVDPDPKNPSSKRKSKDGGHSVMLIIHPKVYHVTGGTRPVRNVAKVMPLSRKTP